MSNVHLLYGAKLETVALEVLLEYDKCFKVGQWSYPCGFYLFYFSRVSCEAFIRWDVFTLRFLLKLSQLSNL